MRKRFVSRWLLATGGILLLCLVVYLGLGWVVMTQQDWFRLRIGRPKFDHLWRAYAYTFANLLPRDTDGDGICDGFEIFDRTDPKHPLSHRTLVFSLFEETFSAFDGGERVGEDSGADLVLRAGLRCSLEGRVGYYNADALSDPELFPPNLRLRIVPPQNVAVGLPGRPLSREPIEALVRADGTMAFDVGLGADDPGDWKIRGEMVFLNAATGERLSVGAAAYDVLYLRVIRELPSIDASIELIPGEENFDYIGIFREFGDQCMIYVRWPVPPPEADHVLLEGARDETGAKWRAIRIYPRDVTKCGLLTKPTSFPGMLKFRIVPIVSPAAR